MWNSVIFVKVLGRKIDRQNYITRESGFLKFIEPGPGDVVLVDRGFDIIGLNGGKLEIPSFKHEG